MGIMGSMEVVAPGCLPVVASMPIVTETKTKTQTMLMMFIRVKELRYRICVRGIMAPATQAVKTM